MPKKSKVNNRKPSAEALDKLDAMTDADIQRGVDADSDAAPLDLDLSQFTRRRGQRGPQKKPTKRQVTLRIDEDVLESYRAEGKGWQTKANAALRAGTINNEMVVVKAPSELLDDVAYPVVRTATRGQFVAEKAPARHRSAQPTAAKKKATTKKTA